MSTLENKTIAQLRAIAKQRGMKGFWKLKKAELASLLNTPKRPPRRNGQRRSLRQVDIQPTPEAMETFEKQELAKNRSTVKSKLNELYDWLIKAVPEPVKKHAKTAYDKAGTFFDRIQ